MTAAPGEEAVETKKLAAEVEAVEAAEAAQAPEAEDAPEVTVAPDLDDPSQFEDAGVEGESVPGWTTAGPAAVPPTAFAQSPDGTVNEQWSVNLSPSAVVLPKALAERSAEVIRYWESIELLTPPDFEADERTARWTVRPETVSERVDRTRWTKQILEGDDVVLDLNAPPEELKTVLPVFRVMVGVIPKRAYYAHLMRTLLVPGTEASDVGGLDNIRGEVFLASFELNPWGRLVEESYGVTGAVGVLDLVRLKRAWAEKHPAEARRMGFDPQAFTPDEAFMRNFVVMGRFREAAFKALNWAPPEKRINYVAERTRPGETEGNAPAVEDDWDGYEYGGPGQGGQGRSGSSDGSAPSAAVLDGVRPIRFRNVVGGEPVTPEWIEAFARRLAERIGWEGDLGIAVRTEFEHPSRNLEPRRDLLESFYLEDLGSVRGRLAPEEAKKALDAAMAMAGVKPEASSETSKSSESSLSNLPGLAHVRPAVGMPLARLLSAMFEEKATERARRDVLTDPEALKPFVAPAALPLGRWPLDQHQHLYVAQQGAVALMAGLGKAGKALDEVPMDERLLAVNGPPGTGKSFILRDIIADIVVERAKRIAALPDAAALFAGGPVVRFQDWDRERSIQCPNPAVTGDGVIVVASNNNAAIRNITDDLPTAFSLERTEAFSYWHEPAGAFLWATSPSAPRPARGQSDVAKIRKKRFIDGVWGLASATLGRSSNCSAFERHVLACRKGDPKKSPRDRIPTVTDRLAYWAEPAKQSEARARWQGVKTAFLSALAEVEKLRDGMAAREADMLAKNHPPAVYVKSMRQDPAQHKTSVWVDGAFEKARAELFLAALNLHRATLEAEAPVWIENLVSAGRWLMRPGEPVLSGSAANVLETLSMLVPVISTTLASARRLFRGVGPGELGWVFVDEASQATPASAVGLLDRAKKAVVIGDSRQLRPIVPMPERLCEHLRRRARGVDEKWSPAKSSLQDLADRVMPWGTTIRDAVSGTDVWTGFPLRTHLRCQSPMFDIANAVSYDGQMVQMTPRRDAAVPELSCWLDVDDTPTTGNTSEKRVPQMDIGAHATRKQVNACELEVLEGVLRGFNRTAALERTSIFVISPFRAVANAAQKLIEAHRWEERYAADTVHSFQGREADVVILVLGSRHGKDGRPQRRWASNPANLINVAVTRAKRDLIVIGSLSDWRSEKLFGIAARLMRRGVLLEGEVFEDARSAQATANRLATEAAGAGLDALLDVPTPGEAKAQAKEEAARRREPSTAEAVYRAVDAMRTDPAAPKVGEGSGKVAAAKPAPQPEAPAAKPTSAPKTEPQKAPEKPSGKTPEKPAKKADEDPLVVLSKPIDDVPWTW